MDAHEYVEKCKQQFPEHFETACQLAKEAKLTYPKDDPRNWQEGGRCVPEIVLATGKTAQYESDKVIGLYQKTEKWFPGKRSEWERQNGDEVLKELVARATLQ